MSTDPRRIVAATVIALVASICVTFSPGAIPVATAGTPCSHLTVNGTVKAGSSVKRGWGVALFLHNRPDAIAGGRTASNGRFSIPLCRTAAVKAYAKQHQGHVNLDVIAHRRAKTGPFLIRIVAPKLTAAVVTVPAKFVVLATVNPQAAPTTGNGVVNVGATTSRTIATGVERSAPFIVHPPAMYLEKVPYETTTWSIDSDHLSSVATSVGVSAGADGGQDYGIAGSIEIAGHQGFETGGHIEQPQGSSSYAVTVRPEIQASMIYTCHLGWRSYRYFVSTLGEKCSWGMDAEWTGDVTLRSTTYRGCHAGSVRAQNVTNHGPTDRDFYSANTGSTYTVKDGFKSPYVTGDFSTTYMNGTTYRYTLSQTKTTHHFCVGGNGPTLATSSALYITNTDSTSPASCAGARSTTVSRPASEATKPEQHPGGSC